MTMDSALDYLAEHLKASEEPILRQIESNLAQRVLKALDGNEAAAAKRLGLTKPALKKLLQRPPNPAG
jgi:DNA-binding protein Fis